MIITKPREYVRISQRIQRGEPKYNVGTVTSLGLSDDLLMYGTSEGVLKMYDREREDEYETFFSSKKDSGGNAITAIDVHPLRTEYIVIGNLKGQLILLDVTNPKKALKTIKDYHKGVQIVNVKFCDWRGKHHLGEDADNSY